MVHSTRQFVLSLALYDFVLVFSVHLASRLLCLGKRELILIIFRTFVRFALVWFCLFPPPPGVWEGLRFVIVALPGLSRMFLFISDARWF